jgi:Family of unknown function (DUF6519)
MLSGTSCEDVANWPPPPSGGRLTSDTVPGGTADDPCIVPPGGGFTGLENRLYRVEVHDGSQPGPPTFKWSRDNGSATFAIEEFVSGAGAATDQVRLRRLDRAGVRSLRVDDWVEILDDGSELSDDPVSRLVRVTDVDELERIVTLSAAVSGYEISRHARIRRWDQESDAVLIDTSVDQQLEDGIRVRFSGSDFVPGDYWTFAARTAIGDVEHLHAAPPDGIRHHYCKLAIVSWERRGNGASTCQISRVEHDCRSVFPPLTEICAEDVCFDNDICGLTDVETVQDVLDRLCVDSDLRFHKKHLHGWGIVCGLQLHCDECKDVALLKGYAIDCDGRDILVNRSRPVKVLDRIRALKQDEEPPSTDLDGDYAVILGLDDELRQTIKVEPYEPPKNLWESLLPGTLLSDVLEDCVGKLISFVHVEFATDGGTEGGGTALVSPLQRRLTTFGNLLIQLVDHVNGQHVFLSKKEHEILKAFYERLRAQLTSPTFCALFKGARPFPDYPFGERPTTIFGKGGHVRLRLDPDGQHAYTCGADELVHAYDLQQEELVNVLTFPGSSSALVRDVAVTGDGRLHAIASQGDDTFFASYDLRGGTWGPTTTICAMTLLTLGVLGDDVYAVGYRKPLTDGGGLYRIDPDAPDPPTEVATETRYLPTGQYALVEDTPGDPRSGVAYVAIGPPSSGNPPRKYVEIARTEIAQGQTDNLSLQDGLGTVLGGDDDLIAYVDAEGTKRVSVVVDDSTTTPPSKQLLSYDASAWQNPNPVVIYNLEDTPIRLAFDGETGYILLSFADSYRVIPAVPQTGETLEDPNGVEYRHPVQITPMALVYGAEREEVYALNEVSRTITVIPAGDVPTTPFFDIDALVDYRNAVLAAFADLAGAFLQHLKDCVCDHLLVNCPECDGSEKLYLGTVHVLNQEVYSVCNFSERRYVKTFPTVQYWLSLVPVLPLVALAVEKVCCLVLPAWFSRFDPKKGVGKRHFGGTKAALALSELRGVDPSLILGRATRDIEAGGLHALRWLERFVLTADRRLPKIPPREPMAAAPTSESLHDEVTALRADLADLEKRQKRALATRDRKIAALRRDLEQASPGG